jgi:hypothetical protein
MLPCPSGNPAISRAPKKLIAGLKNLYHFTLTGSAGVVIFMVSEGAGIETLAGRKKKFLPGP